MITYPMAVRLLSVSLLLMPGCGKDDGAHEVVDTKKFNIERVIQDRQKRGGVEGGEYDIDIAVLGSGPAGLGAGGYGADSKAKAAVFEGPNPGGLIMNTEEVDNWSGYGGKSGAYIIEHERDSVAKRGVKFIGEEIVSINLNVWPYELTTAGGDVYKTLTLVLATGASPYLLNVKGEKEYFGRKGVATCANCEKRAVQGKDVVIVGGGDSAAVEAVILASFAKSVTILVRKDKMRAFPRNVDRLANYKNISVRYNVEVQEMQGDGKHITGVLLKNNKTGKTEVLPTYFVFLAIGHEPNSKLVKGKVDVDERGYIKVKGRTQKTSVPGVFAAGEVEDHRYRQGRIEAAHGDAAGLDAVEFLNNIGYSSYISDTEREVGEQSLPESVVQHVAEVAAKAEEKPQAIPVKEEKIASAKPVIATKPAQGGGVKHVKSLAEVEKLIAGDKPVILDGFAEWCGPCQTMAPRFARAAEANGDKVIFVKVDVDEVPEVAEKFGINRMPTFVWFKAGKKVGSAEGAQSDKQLQAIVDKLVE